MALTFQPSVAHGGDLAAVRTRFPDAPEPWIDLSTGINPWPYPVPVLAAECWAQLPGAGALAALLNAAAGRYGVKAGDAIVAAPGTQSLIQLLPQLLPASRVAVIGPTYAEHARAWARYGHAVIECATIDPDADGVVLVNPDNPTGRISPKAELHGYAKALKKRGGLLVVDEAFADLEPGISLVSDLPANAIVLRSFGKTYGLAGLRLGFAVAQTDIAAKIADLIGPWGVSGPAIEIGRKALSDADWLAETRTRTMTAAARLDRILEAAGLDLLGGTPLFRLAKCSNADRVVKILGRAGIHIRSFAERPGALRFGLPGPEDHWARLESALSQSTSPSGPAGP